MCGDLSLWDVNAICATGTLDDCERRQGPTRAAVETAHRWRRGSQLSPNRRQECEALEAARRGLRGRSGAADGANESDRNVEGRTLHESAHLQTHKGRMCEDEVRRVGYWSLARVLEKRLQDMGTFVGSFATKFLSVLSDRGPPKGSPTNGQVFGAAVGLIPDSSSCLEESFSAQITRTRSFGDERLRPGIGATALT